MAENVIAIILPEYEDEGNVITSDDWKREYLLDDTKMGERIKRLAEFVDFFSDENCLMIYDNKNISAFAYVLRTMPDCYPSRESQLRTALNKAANWRSPANRKSSEKDEYTIGMKKLQDETRCELATRKAEDCKNSCLIVAHIPSFKSKTWKLSKDGEEYEIDSCQLEISEVFDWISRHQKPERTYNWNSKHGENGLGAHKEHARKEVSVLLCSREHANELLPKAIGLQGWDYLYSFDPDYGKFMEYKAECKYIHLHPNASDRKYHSYHLNSAEYIPKRIMEKINILKSLLQARR